MARSQIQYLVDIDETMTDAQRFAEGHTLEEFQENRQLRYAIERTLKIIGEATSNVSDRIKSRDNTLPWREMRALRNIVAHEYHRVEPARVWQVIQEELPRTQEKIRALVQELKEDSP